MTDELLFGLLKAEKHGQMVTKPSPDGNSCNNGAIYEATVLCITYTVHFLKKKLRKLLLTMKGNSDKQGNFFFISK